MVNEAGAALEGGWGPRQEGQRAGGRGMGGCGDGKYRSVLNRMGRRGRDGGKDWIYDSVAPTWSSDEQVMKMMKTWGNRLHGLYSTLGSTC